MYFFLDFLPPESYVCGETHGSPKVTGGRGEIPARTRDLESALVCAVGLTLKASSFPLALPSLFPRVLPSSLSQLDNSEFIVIKNARSVLA